MAQAQIARRGGAQGSSLGLFRSDRRVFTKKACDSFNKSLALQSPADLPHPNVHAAMPAGGEKKDDGDWVIIIVEALGDAFGLNPKMSTSTFPVRVESMEHALFKVGRLKTRPSRSASRSCSDPSSRRGKLARSVAGALGWLGRALLLSEWADDAREAADRIPVVASSMLRSGKKRVAVLASVAAGVVSNSPEERRDGVVVVTSFWALKATGVDATDRTSGGTKRLTLTAAAASSCFPSCPHT